MNKNATHEITDILGIEQIADHLGVTPRTVRLARTTGEFAASWYVELKSLADANNVACPLDAFSFKAPFDSPQAGVKDAR